MFKKVFLQKRVCMFAKSDLRNLIEIKLISLFEIHLLANIHTSSNNKKDSIVKYVGSGNQRVKKFG